MATLKYLIVLIAICVCFANADNCAQRSYGFDTFVCVCNATFCDYLDPLPKPAPGEFTRVITSRDTYRFGLINGTTSPVSIGNISVTIDHNYSYQKILGFGGAFTDSAGLNVATLSKAAQDNYIRSYFATDGLGYSVCRIPIAGADFSTHPYSYDDVDGDVDLEFFNLTYEDYNYKLPYIQDALELNPDLLLFASPWAPPAWMKVSNMTNGTGGLLREMWDPYANYLVKFVKAYESYNLTIWGITPQNEPMTGFIEDFPWNTCAWTAEEMRDWIKTSMGPAFKAANLRRIKVMTLDHNRDDLPWYPATIYEDIEATQYVDGTAVHWYADLEVGPEVLTEIRAQFPDKFLLYTEACVSWYRPDAVHLGEWNGAEKYATNIIEDLNHWSIGWVDWNMALDMDGGPNWANNPVDAPIIINRNTDEFYKQTTYYVMGHFSKFVHRDASRLYCNVLNQDKSVRAAAFHNPDGTDVVVLLNMNDFAAYVSVLDHVGEYVNVVMEAKSIETIIITS